MNKLCRNGSRILFVAFSVLACAQVEATALDWYVAKPDPAYSYRRVALQEGVLATTHFLSMVSQQWRSATEVDRPLWQHDVAIVVPRAARLGKPRTAILLVDGGSNRDQPAQTIDDSLEVLATLTGSVVAVVRQVPNQPLTFLEESPMRSRSEDAVLAYGAQRFLASCAPPATTCDRAWLAHLAMVKSVVRAMDTVQDYLRGRKLTVTDFVLTGASKRAWTTWLTAAVDSRVRGIIPISFDMLNIEQQIARQWAAYGGNYASALADYTAPNLFCAAKNTPAGKRLLATIDPYAYRDRLRMPKLIINSAGDQFFLPDGSQIYYRQLPGDNRLRYTFNTDHGQAPVKDVLLSAVAWYNDIKRSKRPPRYDWEVRNGKIIVTTAGPVKDVWLWQATDAQDPETRDFRLATLGAVWTRQALTAVGEGRYEAPLTFPAPGSWNAHSVEIDFENKRSVLDKIEDVVSEASLLKRRQVFTTDVVIRPRRLPRDPALQCAGP